MKSFFSRSGANWPEMQWINTDSITALKDFPEVPEGEFEVIL